MVTFYVKDKKQEYASIRCSVQPKGLKRFHFTVPNTKIKTSEWDEGRMKTGRGKQENSYVQNDLNRLKEKIENFYSEYYRNYNKYPSQITFQSYLKTNKSTADYFSKNPRVKLVDYIKEKTDQRINGQELTKGKKFSPGTINCYNSLILALENFQDFNRKKHYYLDDMLSKELIYEFENYLTNVLKMHKNTIQGRLKTLKTFLQLAVNDNLIDFNPFKKYNIVLTTEESDVIVFSEEDLEALEGLDFSDNPFYDKIRDQYLIYVWSGIRKSDLKNFLSVINPTTKSYEFRSSKTGELNEIPAFDTLKRLGQKYNYQFPQPVHDTIVLREIKEICKLIPSMCVPVEKKYTKGGVEVREIKKKYELVVIHTARRTLATILVDRGLPYHLVMKITGHKKITTLQKYIKSKTDLDLMLKIGNGGRT